MRYVLLKNVEPGAKIGADIYDAFGRVLLGHHAPLTQEYIVRLQSMGFDGVYIDDKLTDDLTIEPLVNPRLRSEGVECVRRMDLDGCQEVARKMVEDILAKGTISLDMADLREKDDYTYTHSVNVALYSTVIGIGLNLSEKQLVDLMLAGLLHDLGKLEIPDEILNKPSRLTQEEFQLVKLHPVRSYDIIKDRWDVSAFVKAAVLFHHENVDGSGYPKGIPGEEHSLYTKIIHVADVYDALVSKRAYKNPYSPYEASEYLMGGCGIMFDQEMVQALLDYVPLYPKGHEMILSDGRHCIIYDNSGIHNLRPIVKLVDSGVMIDLTEPDYLKYTLTSTEGESDVFNPKSEEERKQMVSEYHKYKILVVDDMITNLQMLRGILEYLYDLALVKSGRQAIAYFKKNEWPDLVIMDIDMPEMNGVEAARAIQEMTNNRVPILFVTARSDRDTVLQCHKMGAAGYIIRPYKPAFIKSELKRILVSRGVEK